MTKEKELNLAYFQTKTAHRWLLFSLILSIIGTAFGIFQFSLLVKLPVGEPLAIIAIILGWTITVGLVLAYLQLSKRQTVNRVVFKLIYALYALDIVSAILSTLNIRSLIESQLSYSEAYAFNYIGGTVFTGGLLAGIVFKIVPYLIAYVTDLRIKEYNELVSSTVSEEIVTNVVPVNVKQSNELEENSVSHEESVENAPEEKE